jgi:K(+)-stimulated pyrophosphate-energized sodium pump
MGPVTIAVDSYGPVTDNAQSVYELSTIESIPGIEAEIQKDFGFKPNFEKAKEFLEENDGAGNTFKATAKPVLIGTAVVGATTMIFSIIVMLTKGLKPEPRQAVAAAPAVPAGPDRRRRGDLLVHRRFDAGRLHRRLPRGGVHQGQHQARGRDQGERRGQQEGRGDLHQYAQKGMFNIFLTVFFSTLAFAFVEPYFFIGYLISIALFGLYQAIFMANAGGAWDNAKKIVETELKGEGHAAARR